MPQPNRVLHNRPRWRGLLGNSVAYHDSHPRARTRTLQIRTRSEQRSLNLYIERRVRPLYDGRCVIPNEDAAIFGAEYGRAQAGHLDFHDSRTRPECLPAIGQGTGRVGRSCAGLGSALRYRRESTVVARQPRGKLSHKLACPHGCGDVRIRLRQGLRLQRRGEQN